MIGKGQLKRTFQKGEFYPVVPTLDHPHRIEEPERVTFRRKRISASREMSANDSIGLCRFDSTKIDAFFKIRGFNFTPRHRV